MMLTELSVTRSGLLHAFLFCFNKMKWPLAYCLCAEKLPLAAKGSTPEAVRAIVPVISKPPPDTRIMPLK